MRETQDPNDLAFEAGDIIEVITETNVDWWTGRNRSGKEGLFPSNYVEKLPSRGLSPIFVPEPRKLVVSVQESAEQRYSSPALPHPQPHAHVPPQPYPGTAPFPTPGAYYPPPAGLPPGTAYAPPAGPPAPPPAPQQAPAKKNKFGGLGQVVSVRSRVAWLTKC